MLGRRPDLAQALYQDVWRSRLGEEAGGEALAYPLPVFGQRDGRFTSHFSLTYIEAAQKMTQVKRLTDRQREAIDMLMALAEELCFEMRFAESEEGPGGTGWVRPGRAQGAHYYKQRKKQKSEHKT